MRPEITRFRGGPRLAKMKVAVLLGVAAFAVDCSLACLAHVRVAAPPPAPPTLLSSINPSLTYDGWGMAKKKTTSPAQMLHDQDELVTIPPPRNPAIAFHERIPVPPSVKGKCGRSILWSRNDIKSNSTDVIGNFGVLTDAGYVATELNEFPWQVWLSGRHFFNQSTACGGVLVNADWVLTSANCCISLAPKALTIVGGWTSGFMNDKFSVKVAFMSTSSEIVVHPLSHATRMGYDFCLVRISKNATVPKPISFDSWNIQPICLPTSCEDPCMSSNEAIITNTGFTNTGFMTGSIKTRKAAVNLILPEECQASYNHSLPGRIHSNMVCARVTGFNWIPGSAEIGGSPLTCYKNNAFTLEGVWSREFTKIFEYQVISFVRVCSVLDWIKRIIST